MATADACIKLDLGPKNELRSWVSIQPLPVAMASFSMVGSNTSLYTFGGRMSSTQCSSAVHKYDIASDTWTADFSTIASGQRSFGHCHAVRENGDVWIMGG